MKTITGLTLTTLELKREQALSDLIEAREADFASNRVAASARTLDALARLLVLEELIAAAVSLTHESERRPAARKGGEPSANDSLDLK